MRSCGNRHGLATGGTPRSGPMARTARSGRPDCAWQCGDVRRELAVHATARTPTAGSNSPQRRQNRLPGGLSHSHPARGQRTSFEGETVCNAGGRRRTRRSVSSVRNSSSENNNSTTKMKNQDIRIIIGGFRSNQITQNALRRPRDASAAVPAMAGRSGGNSGPTTGLSPLQSRCTHAWPTPAMFARSVRFGITARTNARVSATATQRKTARPPPR